MTPPFFTQTPIFTPSPPPIPQLQAPLQYALTTSLAAALLLKVATYVAKQLEPRIRRKRFNLLGALQFEADARVLAQFFTTRAGPRARDRFARVATIAALLACETPAEAAEAAKSVRLSPEEIASIMKQRVDWK